ncbi:DNA polymerase III subunit gamma and tau [Arthrobacter sp. 8AJ]|uniref:DNA polymerase III subunit gamma and tau n=1 Tax=Arthrobacter sp. 8AJ TaxID=2653130 RepID=UPI001F2A5E47|nr:DNA polymerase III subunit gamma and tau [Arthrobacter sp. 8AJ]
MTVTTALYRRYRPDSFADVIGQEHVTEPLMTALRKNRVNHAYLFSGPRGCGKTTSARILARCLNCAQGPTDTPCGTCPSCVELARGGSGSLDVIEIDAASHGGVDDARDLRERATYAPVRDRYKIFIIDEAHMVTSAGFNALLKIVEEPPEHIKFIFATTEPDKVIGTIRSRTHHYPFRLVPPEPLMAYLELLCRQENVPVAPGVLSLVIRAGGGSVRDSLSVLDQLMAGAGPNGLDYELAVALLGYTHASLLDDVVEAVAASDAATVFRAVDRVIQTGHDPRRFVEDLLERFRDLIIVQAMPESAHAILRGMPADQIARLQNQAHNLGAAELSRAADVTNTALTEMTGATSPRLHLELLCARILLPSAEQNERGMAARIERVERRLNYAGNDVGAPATAAPASAEAPAAVQPTPVQPTAVQPTAPAATPAGSPLNSQRAHQPAAPEPSANTAAAHPSAAQAAGAQSASAQAGPAAPAWPGSGDEQVAPAPDGARSPLTPPRVSTSDWPVEEPSRPRTPQGPQGSAPGAGTTNPTQRASSGPQDHAALQAQDNAAPQAQAQAQAAPQGQEDRPAPGQAAATRVPDRPQAQSDQVPASHGPGSNSPGAQTPGQQVQGQQAPVHQAPAAHHQAPGGSSPANPPAMGDVEVLRRAWPDVLQALSKIKRSTWALVEPNAQVQAFDGSVLTLSFTTSGLAGAFGRADHSDNLRQAIHKTVGIDCQIQAVAGGASQASSEPNPKVPASPVVPATSADVAWGLAPASASASASASAQATPAVQVPAAAAATGTPLGGSSGSPAAAGSSPAAGSTAPYGSSGSSAVAASPSAAPAAAPSTAAPSTATPPGAPSPGARPAADANARGNHGMDPAGSGPIATAGASARAAGTAADSSGTNSAHPAYPPAGGDYSYSDDDWGPPRDEDAPPLDEEPPMDWEPSARPGNRPAPPSPATGADQAAGGAHPAAAARPQGTGGPGSSTASQPAGQPASLPAGAAHDPWTRAVEQAPGVWVVGDKSNVGAKPAPASANDNIGASASVPHYEPATAQVPPSIPVAPAATAAAAAGPDWAAGAVFGSGRTEPDAGPYQAQSPDPSPVPEFAMAAAAPAPVTHASAAQATVAQAPVPQPTASQAAVAQAAARASVAQAPAAPSRPQPGNAAPASAGTSAPAAGRTETRQSLYQRLSNSPEAEAGRAKAPARAAAAPSAYVQDIPSADDETIEESGVFGRAAVERILGGKLIEERSLDGSPVTPRY